ncbi:MAG: HlyD family type I secretion periplasmic adaptor subunit [Piscirickettsiaceae bacterium]|nr:HlyD family type I secretion periplasmic adaptor subunit [Piscirickettsiaceae bacterium]
MNQPQPIGQSDWPVVKTGDAFYRIVGLLIIVLCFGLFGSWAALAPLERAAFAAGTVKVASNKKTVQHLEGGTVKRILVQDGEAVEAGDLLVELDSSQLVAQFDVFTHQLMQARIIAKRLLAEQQQKLVIDVGSIALPKGDKRTQVMLANQQDLLIARTTAMSGRVNVLQQRIRQLESNRSGLIEQNNTTRMLLASYETDLNDQNELLKEGYAQISRVRDLERNISTLNGDVAKVNSSINALDMQVNETKLNITQLRKDRAAEVAQQLAETDMAINELQEKNSILAEKISRTLILAPVTGNVLNMTLHTVGGVVAQGRSILDIVPYQDRLIVEAQIAINDIDSVAVGSTADIRFSVFNEVKSTVIEGRIEYISADRLVSENGGFPYYLARIEVTDKGMIALEGHTLIPGMPAEVLINTGTRTLLQYLLQPALEAYSRSFIEE